MQIYGNGKQTRSFQYVSDLIDGLVALMSSNYTQPINIGNPVEHTIEGLLARFSFLYVENGLETTKLIQFQNLHL